MNQWNPLATSYTYPLSMVHIYTIKVVHLANSRRTEGFTAMMMEKLNIHTQIRTFVSQVSALLLRPTSVVKRLPSVRQCCQETKPC